jgi:hypothetical protein
VRAILQGEDNAPERVEDWLHQPTLLLPTGNRQQTTDNRQLPEQLFAFLRGSWEVINKKLQFANSGASNHREKNM